MSAEFSALIFAMACAQARAVAHPTCPACGGRLVRVEGGHHCPACCARDARCVFCDGAVAVPVASEAIALGGPACRACAKPAEEVA
jgi:hypothetical protein